MVLTELLPYKRPDPSNGLPCFRQIRSPAVPGGKEVTDHLGIGGADEEEDSSPVVASAPAAQPAPATTGGGGS